MGIYNLQELFAEKEAVMRTEQEIKDAIAEIEKDCRYQYSLSKPATVFANAPLALIQVKLQALHDAYTWVLGEIEGQPM